MRYASTSTKPDSIRGTSPSLGDTDSVDVPAHPEVDYIARNKAAWERWAVGHVAAGRAAWQADELQWGLWSTPESELGLIDGFRSGDDAVELGCGTAAISAWLARSGIRAVALDIARAQLQTAESLQHEFKVKFPLVRANAEEIAFDGESFDLAISEYGASLWCDPRRWLSEAHRLLRPEGRLVFFTVGALLLTCTPHDGSPATQALVRDYFSRYLVEFEKDGPLEFHLTPGHWIRLLREVGFVVDDLIEVRPQPTATARVPIVSPEWAKRWPSEEIWIAHKA